ncbi:MAG: hypothetical protein WBD27_13620 [Pyrinomonadaceae bacterium]
MRIDLSEQLIHLTRGDRLADAESSFRSIFKEKALRGSGMGIRGGHKVVCFSEAPVGVLAQLFSRPGHDFRYRPFGVMVPKAWLFALGGRPVIYQPETEFDTLPTALQYRHVRFDTPGGNKDFTFEREWRINTDALQLDPATCTLIVPDREWDYRLRQEHDEHDMKRASSAGFGPFTRMTNYPWHVLALGDLGAAFPINDD